MTYLELQHRSDPTPLWQDYKHECVVLHKAPGKTLSTGGERRPNDQALLAISNPLYSLAPSICSPTDVSLCHRDEEEGHIRRKIYESTRIVTPDEAIANPRFDRSGIEMYKRKLEEFFGKEALEKLKGRYVIVPYLDLGYGHRNQAEDIAIILAGILGVNAVFTSPLANITDEERFMFKLKAIVHKTLQNGGDIREAVNSEYERQAGKKSTKSNLQRSVVAPMLGFTAKVLAKNEGIDEVQDGPEDEEGVSQPKNVWEFRSWLHTMFARSSDHFMRQILDRIENNDDFARSIFRAFTSIDSTVSEKALGRVVRQMARDFDAVGVVATHSAALRELKGINIPIISAIPDLGYIPRAKDPKDDGKNDKGKEDMMGQGILLEAFLGLGNPDIVYTVADTKVKKCLERFGVEPDKVWETGTICDSISVQEFIEKWTMDERRFLMSVNGNASNVDHMIRLLGDLAGSQDQSWRDKNYKFKIFLADRAVLDRDIAQKKKTLEQIINENNMADFVEIVETDPVGKFETSEKRQELQRWAHVEWRTPGENILTGGNVGCCEVAMPAGRAVNEQENLMAMTRDRYALAGPYPNESHKYWAQVLRRKGVSDSEFEGYGLNTQPIETANEFLSYLFDANQDRGTSLAERVATHGFMNMDRDANFAIAAILVSGVLGLSGKNQSELSTLIRNISSEHKQELLRMVS